MPVLPRFLPEFDNLILSHADRTRVVPDDYRKALASKNGMVPATILVDGFLCGTWRIEKSRSTATLVIEPFETLPERDRSSLAEEGERLVRFVEEGAKIHDIRFERVS
jgi:hypothetical protein